MRYRRNLRFRVAFAFALFGTLANVLLALVLYWAIQDLGKRLIDETLNAELDDLMARRERNPHSLPPQTAIMHGYIQTHAEDENLPPYLRALPPGRHQITAGAVNYRVAVVDRQGERYFLLYDTNLQRKREWKFVLLMGAGVLMMGLLFAVGGIWLASGIIAPVSDLASRVRNRDPRQWTALLAEDFPQDDVGELARVFDHHMDRLRGFMERERAFTADLSHELRTSLTVILSVTEILLADETLTERQKNRVARVDRAGRDMAELGTALLLMAREEGALRIDGHCHVAEVITEIVERCRYLLLNKPVRLEVRTDPAFTLTAERGLVFIALSNLVRNAFTYTEQGEVTILQEGNRLTVRDSGRGIPSHQMEAVFLRHFRDAASEGAGIGLSLVKRIADRYGWTLRLESREGGGTLISVTFPDRPQPQPEQSTPRTDF